MTFNFLWNSWGFPRDNPLMAEWWELYLVLYWKWAGSYIPLEHVILWLNYVSQSLLNLKLKCGLLGLVRRARVWFTQSPLKQPELCDYLACITLACIFKQNFNFLHVFWVPRSWQFCRTISWCTKWKCTWGILLLMNNIVRNHKSCL